MCASWRKDYERPVILSALEPHRAKGNEGRPVFPGGPVNDVLGVLTFALEFSKPLPELERRRIVTKALFAAAAHPLTASSVLREVSKLESEFARHPAEPYVLVAFVSLDLGVRMRPRSISGASMRFSRLPDSWDCGHPEPRFPDSPASADRATEELFPYQGVG